MSNGPDAVAVWHDQMVGLIQQLERIQQQLGDGAAEDLRKAASCLMSASYLVNRAADAAARE